LSKILTGANCELEDPALGQMSTYLELEMGWEGDNLVDRAIVPHFNQRCEILDIASIRGEGIVIHADSRLEISGVLQMVFNSDFIPTGITILNGVVDNRTVEPVMIPEFELLMLVLVLNLISQEVFIIQLFIMDLDNFRSVRDQYLRGG
jgi:hypothetical protein